MPALLPNGWTVDELDAYAEALRTLCRLQKIPEARMYDAGLAIAAMLSAIFKSGPDCGLSLRFVAEVRDGRPAEYRFESLDPLGPPVRLGGQIW